MSERLEVFTVRKEDGNSKGYWSRIGVAFQNKSGGWNVKLDALPVNGELVMMPPKPRDDQQPSGVRGGNTRFPDGEDLPF